MVYGSAVKLTDAMKPTEDFELGRNEHLLPPAKGNTWHDVDIGSSDSSLVLILVAVGVIAVAVICILTYWWWRKKTVFKHKKYKSKTECPQEVAISMRGRVRESPCFIAVEQREVKQTVSYDLLGKQLDSYFGASNAWVFASPIYDCMEHGAEGLFELQFQMWATGTKLLLCHNPLSNVEQPRWEFIEDHDFVIDEEKKLYKVNVTSLCEYCIAAYGEFKESLVILPFVRPDPNNWRIITCMLFFAREPASTNELEEMIREVSHPIISGKGAVFCEPTQTVTVMNSELFVQCTVPVNCVQVHLPWTEKILRVEQFKDLQEQSVTGRHVEFEMELKQIPRSDELPRLQLSFYNCDKQILLGPIRISLPPFLSSRPTSMPSCCPSYAGTTFNHLEQTTSGTPLCHVITNVYECDPEMFEYLWKEIAQSHIWGHVPNDICRMQPMDHKFGMHILHYLAHHHCNVTVEKLAAAVSYTGYGCLKDAIQEGTRKAGYSFNEKLFVELLDEEKRVGGRQSHALDDRSNLFIRSETAQIISGIGPIPSSPHQSMVHAAGSSSRFQTSHQTLPPGEPLPIIPSLPSERRNGSIGLPIDMSRLSTTQINCNLLCHLSFDTNGEELSLF